MTDQLGDPESTGIINFYKIPENPMASQPLNVLIVEDNLILSLFEEKLLAQMGHKVVDKAISGEEAELKFKETSPDLIIMDIFLKGDMNGLKTAERIRKHSEIPVIFISGNSDLYQKKCGDLSGINEFITKPFTEHKFAQTIEHIMQQKRMAVQE